jgi:Bacterial PH domain
VAATTWPVRRSLGGDAALWVAGGLLFLALAAVFLGGSREPGASMLLLCAVAAILAAAGTVLLVLAIAYQRLAYALTDSALRIEWLGRTVVVPYSAIQGIYTGQRLSGHATPSIPNWPGISVGPARVRGLGRLRFFATSTDQSMLTLITVEHGGVIVSAREPNEFRAALIERVEASQETSADARTWHQTPATTAPWTALADVWLPVCATVGTVLVLVVLAVIAFRFDALPDQIPLHFDASGQKSFMAPRSDLLRLPLLGLACLAVNWALGMWLHPRERLLARLLWLGGAIVQVVLLMGVLRLVA